MSSFSNKAHCKKNNVFPLEQKSILNSDSLTIYKDLSSLSLGYLSYSAVPFLLCEWALKLWEIVQMLMFWLL